MIISIIAALGDNQAIGYQNQLPWRMPADLAYFKKITAGKPVIMGQKTFESIGKILPGRKQIILTKDPNYGAGECKIAHSIPEALNLAEPAEEVMIAGGASIYQQFLPLVQKMYLTFIHHHFTADTFFPNFNSTQWQEIKREDHQPDNKNLYPYSFVIFEKIKS